MTEPTTIEPGSSVKIEVGASIPPVVLPALPPEQKAPGTAIGGEVFPGAGRGGVVRLASLVACLGAVADNWGDTDTVTQLIQHGIDDTTTGTVYSDDQ